MKSSQELVAEYQGLKCDIEEAVRKGTQFIFNCMDQGRVPSYNQHTKQYGLWPTAEMAEFLLSNQILPKTCSNQIDSIIDFLLSKFKSFPDGSGAWLATVNGTTEYYSAQITGYCTYVLKLYYNEFLADERRNRIREVINQAEKFIISKQQETGFWTPDSPIGEKINNNGINDPDFFYSYHAYLAIKELQQYHREKSRSIENALAQAKLYFKEYANYRIADYKSRELTDTEKCELLSYISKALQVLNDFKDDNLESTIAELHNISLEIFDVAKKNNFYCSDLTLNRVPHGSQRGFHNNTPYDVYFALREEKISAQNLLEVVNWYLNHQTDIGCWYLNGKNEDNNSTWTTTEGLLVLSDAYYMLSEELYLREQQSLDVMQKEYDSYREKIENEKTALLGQNEKYEKTLDSHIKVIKKRNKILLGVSVGASILISIVCFIIFLNVVNLEMDPMLNTFIVVVLLGLGVNAIFQCGLFIWGLVKKKVKELDDMLKDFDGNNSEQ